VEESLRLGPGEDLFDFLASCIKDFLLTQRYRQTHCAVYCTFFNSNLKLQLQRTCTVLMMERLLGLLVAASPK
jgi:hypothetical protein